MNDLGLIVIYDTNHPQLKQHMHATCGIRCVPHVQNEKTCVSSSYTCKINARYVPHARTYPYKVSPMKRSCLQPVASTLSFIMYTCRPILGGIVTHAYTGTLKSYCICCSLQQLARYVSSSHILITITGYIRVTYVLQFIFNFWLVQEAQQKALISLLDMV